MSANDTTAIDEDEPIDGQTFGDATVRIVIDEATDEQLREAYQLAQERSDDTVDEYDMFVLNHTEPEYVVDVEPNAEDN